MRNCIDYRYLVTNQARKLTTNSLIIQLIIWNDISPIKEIVSRFNDRGSHLVNVHKYAYICLHGANQVRCCYNLIRLPCEYCALSDFHFKIPKAECFDRVTISQSVLRVVTIIIEEKSWFAAMRVAVSKAESSSFFT